MSAGFAIFVDRDGVINELVPDPDRGTWKSPSTPDEVRLSPGAIGGLQELQHTGAPVIVVSNQPDAATGRGTPESLRSVHLAVETRLERAGVHIHDYRYCFHHPEGSDAELGRVCSCRKPEPGLILEAAAALVSCDLSHSWLIGDSEVDIEAGRRAGCRTILVENPLSRHRRSGSVEPDERAADLKEAAAMITRLLRGAGESDGVG